MMKPVSAAALVVGLCLAVTGASADDGLTVTGQVQTPLHLGVADIQALPATTVSVSPMAGHGSEPATYSGVLLWTVLEKAGLSNKPGKNTVLRHVILVTGRDGYAVALSAGEIAPDFEGKSVILAIEKDGQPLPAADGIRLIVPGDKRGGRAVRDVVTIDVQ
jgi:DMSO/TMAO reductase YedYZ molybdopterin-dependent catalytic subunit